MATTITPRQHLKLVHSRSGRDTDRDLTDLGVRVPQPRGRALPLTEHQRELVIAGVAAKQGWEGSAEELALRRRALRHDCRRPSCRALATRQCRRWLRGRWRPIDGVHDERAADAAGHPDDTGHADG